MVFLLSEVTFNQDGITGQVHSLFLKTDAITVILAKRF